MKVIFEVNLKGEAAKAESFVQQVSNHLIDYIKENGFVVESIDRKIAFDEEEQTVMQNVQTQEQPAEMPQTIPETPMQVAQEKFKKLKEHYKINK